MKFAVGRLPFLFCVALAAGIAGLGLRLALGPGAASRSSGAEDPGKDTDPAWVEPRMPPPTANPAAGRVPAVDDLRALPQVDQILWVDGLPPGPELTAAECGALLAVLRASDLLAVVRNNAANRLVARRPLDPTVAEAFMAMYRDEGEDPVWRDYCVQFVAESVPALAGDRRVTAVAFLRGVAREDASTIGATALLQEDRLVREGTIDPAPDYGRVLGDRLADSATPGVVRHTLLALIGQGGHREHLPLVRRHLAEPANDDVKRGALYAIGVLGDVADLPAVERYLADPNPGVARAAAAARDRLRLGTQP